MAKHSMNFLRWLLHIATEDLGNLNTIREMLYVVTLCLVISAALSTVVYWAYVVGYILILFYILYLVTYKFKKVNV